MFDGQFSPGQRLQFQDDTIGPGAFGNDGYTKLLLHCDGTDAATSFPDASASAYTVTANGNAQVDTAQSVFGGASALFDGTGDFLSIPDHADLEFGAGDFTIDLRARFNALPGAGVTQTLVRKGRVADADPSYSWNLVNTAGVYSLNFQASVDGSTIPTSFFNTWTTPSTATWYHLTVVRTGTTCRMFVDGVQIGVDATLSDNFFLSSKSTESRVFPGAYSFKMQCVSAVPSLISP